jgi:uncharacterized membrane protein YhaH (DUF805 family)
MQITFRDAVRTCFAKYADFNGRATRPEYWWFFLAVLLGSTATSFIAYRVYELFAVVTLLPLIAAGARRLHDVNRSGWWQLFALVPLGVIVLIVFLIQPSAPTDSAESRVDPQSPEGETLRHT